VAVVKLGVLLVALAACLALLPAAAAPADDRSLRAAGKSRDAQFERLGERTRRAYSAWVDSGHSRRWARRLIRLNGRTAGELDIVRAALRAEEPSSAGGATYKRLLLRALRHFDAALRWDSRGIRRFMRGRRGAARTAWRRASRQFALSRRFERRAVRAIEG
jgi:hypothetical protein